MNGVSGHLCAHVGKTGQGGSPDDGEMNDMTLHVTTNNIINSR